MNAVYRPVFPAAPALEALPERVSERVEILPDLFVEAAVAARIQGLVVSLVLLCAVWAGQAFAPFPVRPLLEVPPPVASPVRPPCPAPAPPGLAERRAYLESFNHERKRALELFCYALAAAPATVPLAAAELSGERLTVTCACADSPAVRGYLKNLRAVVPAAHVAGVAAEAAPVTIDTEAAP